jgi:hypothetical protein
MEGHAQSVENHLLSSLDFNLPDGANFVTNRQSVTFFPQGSNIYAPNTGTRLIKISLNGSSGEWLDPSTVKILMTVTNTDATQANLLRFLANGAWGFFRRARLISSGQVVEDIDYYNRLHEMFHILQPTNHRNNDLIEGFGTTGTSGATAIPGVGGVNSRVVAFTPLFGLFTSNTKYLPLQYLQNISIELELAQNVSEFCNTEAANSSSSFTLTDVQLKCDVITLDNQIQNGYAEYLLDGKSLPIHFSTYTVLSQVGNAGDVTFNITRSATRLKSLFITMLANTANTKKEVNMFYHRMNGTYNKNNEAEIDIQLGSQRYPVYPIRSASEAFYQLRKTMGVHSSAMMSFDITAAQYITDRFIIGVDFEKELTRSFTGANTRNTGSLLRIQLKNTGLDETGRVYAVLHMDSILSLNDSGCIIYD